MYSNLISKITPFLRGSHSKFFIQRLVPFVNMHTCMSKCFGFPARCVLLLPHFRFDRAKNRSVATISFMREILFNSIKVKVNESNVSSKTIFNTDFYPIDTFKSLFHIKNRTNHVT